MYNNLLLKYKILCHIGQLVKIKKISNRALLRIDLSTRFLSNNPMENSELKYQQDKLGFLIKTLQSDA